MDHCQGGLQPNGDVWNYVRHDISRSKTYRWGKGGIAGISGNRQRICFYVTLWNGKDEILKEKLFGFTPGQGNAAHQIICKRFRRLINKDEHFKDLVLFYECFHGENGSGVGASHQTGWTGIIAEIIGKLQD